MFSFLVYVLILNLFTHTQCELNLQIIKSSEGTFTPVASPIIEEKAGANFSLLCDLVSSDETNRNYFDFQVSWVKQPNDLRFWRIYDNNPKSHPRRVFSILPQRTELNKAIKHFDPLSAEDAGKYLCVSLKYNLREDVEIVVRDEKPVFEEKHFFQPALFCSEHMFQCSNGVCIIHHYICDGKADCRDGSDESAETCNGDPCKNKVPCDDGRCIPMSWCCDRHHDPNCTVVNRPKCCQALSDSYEDLEYGSATVTQSHNGARYLFISICTLCILFVILFVLMLVSRVVLMARKSDLSHTAVPSTIENIRLNNQTFTCDNFTYRNSRTTENCDSSDPLLFTEDQPPSYLDVIRTQNENFNLNEPPPPYTSREILNERSGNEN